MIPAHKAHHWHAMALAKEAIELGARVSVVSAFTGLPKYELQRLFCDTQTPGVSGGRHPWSPYWYLTRRVVVEVQAALFYACFRAIRQLGHPASDALVTSYKIYLRHFGHDPRLSFDRAFELITHVEGLWTVEPARLMPVVCHECKSIHITPRQDEPMGTGECPFCKVVRLASRRLLRSLSPHGVVEPRGAAPSTPRRLP